MQQACEKFLKLLMVELEDLEGHVEAVIAETLERGRNGEIAEYVCLSNLAVLRQEKHALGHFCGIITRLHAGDYEKVAELVTALKAIFIKETMAFDLSTAALHFAEHKMQRIEDYIADTHWSEEKKEYLDAVSPSLKS